MKSKKSELKPEKGPKKSTVLYVDEGAMSWLAAIAELINLGVTYGLEPTRILWIYQWMFKAAP